jgi:superfamily I DNA and RNA helicase
MKQKSYFIETEAVNLPGANGELAVWQAVKRVFQDRECFAYWRYPVFSKIGKRRKELDILIVDRILGVITIEVKALKIEQISSMSGHTWNYSNFYEPFGNPYQQSESGLYSILSHFDQYAVLRRKIRGRALVALPSIKENEWMSKGFDQSICVPQVILADHLKSQLLEFIESSTPISAGEVLSDEQWDTMISVLNAGDFHLKESVIEPKLKEYVEPLTLKKKSEVITYMNQFFHEADMAQSIIGLEIPSGIQRIRGIAGSGKTVLLCQKAAIMHLKHPDWKIALVFFTRTLYDQMISTVDRWLKHYSQGEVSYHHQSNLVIFHAWGSKDRLGFYRYMCQNHGVSALAVRDLSHKQPNESLAEAVHHLLSQCDIKPIFDAILIDEGQDLVVDPQSLKYDDKQAIYWLAYQSLKPIDDENQAQKRLIWAYDEAQRLDADAIPSASEIFGEEMKHLLKGKHKGNIQKNHIMKKCYRTPGPILTAAHALGMGFLRKKGVLSGINSTQEWEDIGYIVEAGNFKNKDSLIRLRRPEENSPNPIVEHWDEPIIEFTTYTTRQEEIDAVAKSIKNDIQYHGLKASRNLLIVVLSQEGKLYLEREYAQGFINQGIHIYIATATQLNQIDVSYPNNDPNNFWMDGGVTLSRVARAKGNEAEMVYVVGLDQIAQDESNIALRNQLFVALTRSKAWVKLSGIGQYELYDEVRDVLQAKNTFEFINKPTKDISHEDQLSLFDEKDE